MNSATFMQQQLIVFTPGTFIARFKLVPMGTAVGVAELNIISLELL